MPWLRLLALLVAPLAISSPLRAAPLGTVVVAQGWIPITLDPMNHQETPAANLARNLFDTLLERDRELKIQPALATEMPKLVAPTAWEFKLRPGVKFHNGEPLDAYVHKAGPVWLIGWGTATYDAETVYVPLFHSGKILSNYHNADFDGMVDQAQTTMDRTRRLELYHKINRVWIEDAAAIPLYQQLDLYGATKRMVWKARGDEGIKGYDMVVKDAK